MECLSFNINLYGKQVSQYSNHVFTSMANFNGLILGTHDQGLYELSGYSDADVDIASEVELALTDFGISNPKKIHKVYLGIVSENDLVLTTTVDKVKVQTRIIKGSANLQQRRVVVTLGYDIKGRYWSFNLTNTSGGRFALDSIEVLPIVCSHGHV